jgi:DNA-binding transcriptional ArsR family regulator
MTPSQRLDATFAALADPTRRAILARLGEDEHARQTELAIARREDGADGRCSVSGRPRRVEAKGCGRPSESAAYSV